MLQINNIDEIKLHPVLEDIENMFWFFILSHKTLANLSVQNIIKTTEDSSVIAMLEKYNKWVNLKIKVKNNDAHTSNSNVLNSMIFTGRAMAIITYDFLSLSSYNTIINKDDEFQFLRHIRNGAAHNNKFNLRDEKGNWKIGEVEIIKWNDMEISRKLQGEEIFNGFISIFGIFLLVKHFSERLEKIDKKTRKRK